MKPSWFIVVAGLLLVLDTSLSLAGIPDNGPGCVSSPVKETVSKENFRPFGEP